MILSQADGITGRYTSLKDIAVLAKVSIVDLGFCLDVIYIYIERERE